MKDNLADLNERGTDAAVGNVPGLMDGIFTMDEMAERNMETVRKYVGVDSLMKVMRLFEKFRNRKLEVIILPIEEH